MVVGVCKEKYGSWWKTIEWRLTETVLNESASGVFVVTFATVIMEIVNIVLRKKFLTSCELLSENFSANEWRNHINVKIRLFGSNIKELGCWNLVT
jgi:hypothetical protein